MDTVINGFLKRNLTEFVDDFIVEIKISDKDYFKIKAENGKVYVVANNYISAFHGIYCYLKKYCNVQYSWCGNRKINIESLVMFDGEFSKTIEQKYRVYMNYCTLDYSMCWWDFDRWEKEIDFMAMNGINMPLAVVGCEAVWYETLLEFGFTKEEALSTISGPAFWAWQMMTNIEGYMHPTDESYVYKRADLGKKILQRYLEFGMYPIQQGFSGHVPALMKEKCPDAKILMQKGWCGFPETAQIDPLDPMFKQFGIAYLKNMDKIFGNHHFIACDPFHEGTPPKKGKKYLHDVGHIIDRMYYEFDPDSIWVMQTWSMRKHIVLAVPKDRLLLLDLNSERTFQHRNVWGYPVISGMLHDFGGKNEMQGKLKKHSRNIYRIMKKCGANVVGSGLFMEGIEQNPVVYDLQFELITSAEKINLDAWLDNYITRRYGKYDKTIRRAFDILLKTCYASNHKYTENGVGSAVASSPRINVDLGNACCLPKPFYDTDKFSEAVSLFYQVRDKFKNSDGYQYDLCDLVRQMLSNRFYNQNKDFERAYRKKNINTCKHLAKKQLELLSDLDEITSHRSELCFARWINDSHNLADNEEQKHYFDRNARTLITLWGDVRSEDAVLHDYAWREWCGLIGEYYKNRWAIFYPEAIKILENNGNTKLLKGNNYTKSAKPLFDEVDRKIRAFERKWCETYSEYLVPVDTDVVVSAEKYINKWK